MMRFAADTGGTFTDLVVEDDDGRLHLFKAPTTPDRPVDGVVDVLTVAAEGLGRTRAELLASGDLFVHGTTIATNAILTGQTAKTALLVTEGHPDVLVLREGGRIGLPLFDYSIPYPKPYVPRALTFEVPERLAHDGSCLRPLDESVVRCIIRTLETMGVEAVAVCLLWSIINPDHELRIEALLGEQLPHINVSLSHRVNPSLREYRRASATAIDVSLKPIMKSYLGELERRLYDEGFRGRTLVVTSQGTMKDAREVAAAPIHAVKSGPAMAPVAGRYYVERDLANQVAIVADTGGTTYDVALVRHGRIPETRETWIGRPHLGHMTGFPSIDIRSIGAGGGSIAWVDEGGLLHVGPISAGAVPGPASYGCGGTRATVTDAAVVLGYLDPDYFLGGRMRIRRDLAYAATTHHVAAPLGLATEAAALAVLALLTETMAGAIEDITINQGIDPRTAILIGGGGAAGLNSVAIGRRLGCPQVLFPDAGAALSAVGGLLSPISDNYAELCVTTSQAFDRTAVNTALERLASRCKTFLAKAEGVVASSIEFSVEARYAQQIWEIKLPLSIERFETAGDLDQVCAQFHRLHVEIFAFDDPQAEIEFINWRAAVSGQIRDRPLGSVAATTGTAVATNGRRFATFANGGRIEVPVHRLEVLPFDEVQTGPAIIETPFTTIVVEPNALFYRRSTGSLIVDLKQAQERVVP